MGSTPRKLGVLAMAQTLSQSGTDPEGIEIQGEPSSGNTGRARAPGWSSDSELRYQGPCILSFPELAPSSSTERSVWMAPAMFFLHRALHLTSRLC